MNNIAKSGPDTNIDRNDVQNKLPSQLPIQSATGGVLTLAAAIASGARQLNSAGIIDHARQARMLACHAFDVDTLEVITQPSRPISNQQSEKFKHYCQRRIAGEPIGRIVGKKEFYGLSFNLSKDTLEPRSDTECLVDAILADLKDTDTAPNTAPKNILDIGTGTGAIIISLLCNLPDTIGVESDISAEALQTAANNAIINGVDERVLFVQTNWCEAIEQKFDVIVSNPPYIRTDTIATLSREVKDHDPRVALDGGSDGLDAYREIFTQCLSNIGIGGRLYLEICHDQAGMVCALANQSGWKFDRLIKDLGANDRVLVFKP